MLYMNKHNFTNIILKLSNQLRSIFNRNWISLKLFRLLRQILQIFIITQVQKNNYILKSIKILIFITYQQITIMAQKQGHNTLYQQNRYKLGNYNYRYELKEEIDNFSQEFIMKIIWQQIKSPEEHIKQLFEQYLNLSLVQTQDTPNEKQLVYIPGFIYFEQ
ncbi:unnamed protein product [Paramecium sonneborni]|uniref:Uncharacterized protein n=1 Tax=Paramecium sonneborni TaxID=65129 RepID=A0A8S1KCM8_9CILI|nr:unnamed protein product [Paramecium sonneborni]